ncbi:MAG: hypothetical protein AAF571_02210 [Verrucomicrobiota bacterium]
MLNKALLLIIVIFAALQTPGWAQETEPEKAPSAPSAQKPAEFYFDFLDYRYDLHGRVISRWNELIKANRDKVVPSRVIIRYFINTSGAIAFIESSQPGNFSSEKSNERKLAEYALALENKEPVPFPETVSKEFPKGFFYQIILSIR